MSFAYQAADVRNAARGRWGEVLLRLAPSLRDAIARPGRHVPCPVHGGTNGFRMYRDFEDKDSLISEMDVNEAQAFVDSGSLGGGMLPKLQNCIDAIRDGVSRVHILDGRIPHCLLLEIFTNKGIGTAILNSREERYYHAE